MNEVGCQRAIRKLIQDNEDVLCSEMIQFGQQREIKDVVLSVMTPPVEYYYILVQVLRKIGTNFGGAPGNQAKPHRRAEYNCAVHVLDVAVASGEAGEEQYEMAHTDHRILCDRIEALVCGTYFPAGGTYATYFGGYPICIPDPDSNSEYKLKRGRTSDRVVNVQNQDTTWTDPNSDQYTPIFYSTLTFTMEEEWVR